MVTLVLYTCLGLHYASLIKRAAKTICTIYNAEGLDTSQTARPADVEYIGPDHVGYFSIDGEIFKPDKSQMKYYANPKKFIGSDLNEGFLEDFTLGDKRNTPKEDLEGILRWILKEPSKVNGVEFVLRRGTLVKLCQTKFNTKGETDVQVNLFQGRYFIAADSRNEDLQKEKTEKEKEEEQFLRGQHYRGLKFEKISTTDQPGGVPDEKATVCKSGAYYRVLQGKVSSADESHSILFSAETDCCSRNDNNICEPVELKTYIKGGRTEPDKFTYQRYWLQSYVSGISKMVCGFLTTKGVLQSVEEMTAPRIFNKIANYRYDQKCMPFKDLAKFLKEVKLVVTEDQPSALFNLNGQRCEHQIMDEDFLPDWFKDGWNQHISHRASLCASQHVMDEDFLPKYMKDGLNGLLSHCASSGASRE